MAADEIPQEFEREEFEAWLKTQPSYTAPLIAWRAAVVATAAGDADFAGLNANLNAEQTQVLFRPELLPEKEANKKRLARAGR